MRYNRLVSFRWLGLVLLLFLAVGCSSEKESDADNEPEADTPLPAQLNGVVLSDDGSPLANASLRLVYASGVMEAVAGAEGWFHFDNAPTDIPLTLEASAEGYEPLTQDVAALKAGEMRQVNLTLKAKEPPVPTGTEVGQRAPDFTLPDMNGKAVTLSGFRGKSAALLAFHRGKF